MYDSEDFLDNHFSAAYSRNYKPRNDQEKASNVYGSNNKTRKVKRGHSIIINTNRKSFTEKIRSISSGNVILKKSNRRPNTSDEDDDSSAEISVTLPKPTASSKKLNDTSSTPKEFSQVNSGVLPYLPSPIDKIKPLYPISSVPQSSEIFFKFNKWMNIRENLISKVLIIVNTVNKLRNIDKRAFLKIILSIRKVSLDIVGGYHQLSMLSDQPSDINDIKQYIYKMATDLKFLSHSSFLHVIGMDPTLNPFFSTHRVNGSLALLRRVTVEEDELRLVNLAHSYVAIPEQLVLSGRYDLLSYDVHPSLKDNFINMCNDALCSNN